MCLGEIGRLVEVRPGAQGVVSVADRALAVSLVTLDEPAAVGDWLVVHSGFALARLSAAEAHEALALRAQSMGAPTPSPRPAATAAPRTPLEGSA